MKHSIIALALLAAVGSASAVEDLTLESKDGVTTMTVHSAGAKTFINENDDMQVFAYVSTSKNGTVRRDKVAVSGCDKEGGRFALVDQRTGSLGEQRVWLWTGTSMMDGVAAKACVIATQIMRAKRASKSGYSM